MLSLRSQFRIRRARDKRDVGPESSLTELSDHDNPDAIDADADDVAQKEKHHAVEAEAGENAIDADAVDIAPKEKHNAAEAEAGENALGPVASDDREHRRDRQGSNVEQERMNEWMELGVNRNSAFYKFTVTKVNFIIYHVLKETGLPDVDDGWILNEDAGVEMVQRSGNPVVDANEAIEAFNRLAEFYEGENFYDFKVRPALLTVPCRGHGT